PTDLHMGLDGTVTVPVNIDDPHPAGSTGLTQAILALRYDPTVFSVSAADIHLGTVPDAGTGWTLQARVDAATGEIGLVLFSLTPIDRRTSGSLVTIQFHVRAESRTVTTPINLAAAVNPNGQGVFRTALADNQGLLTLHPAPTDAATDAGVDGLVVLTAAERQRVDQVFRSLAREAGDPADGGRSDEVGPAQPGLQGATRADQDPLAARLWQEAR